MKYQAKIKMSKEGNLIMLEPNIAEDIGDVCRLAYRLVSENKKVTLKFNNVRINMEHEE